MSVGMNMHKYHIHVAMNIRLLKLGVERRNKCMKFADFTQYLNTLHDIAFSAMSLLHDIAPDSTKLVYVTKQL